ncbi:MAG: FHA domain-containing protein [Marinicellaceae bacterium]
MQVEINNKDSIQLPAIGHVIFGTDESCDYVFDIDDFAVNKLISIIQDKAACIIEVFNEIEIFVNNHPIKKMSILHPGDVITFNNQSLKLINENRLPKLCKIPFKINKDISPEQQLITSVSGLRSFNAQDYGELTIVGDQNSFTHKPVTENDIPFSVSFVENTLTLLCKKNTHLYINGNKANYVELKNGDFITTGDSKYCVESPGSSSFSKYSPSHPRNIQLSEEYLVDDKNKKNPPSNFIKKNLWWMTLLVGLTTIAGVLFVLKNMS